MSFFSYRQYYPSLSSPSSHRPFSPRIKREDDHDQGHIPLPSEGDRSSDEAVLPTTRPGYKHGTSSAPGNVGAMGLANDHPPTHPAVPHLHLHPSAGYTEYTDDNESEEARRGSSDPRMLGHTKRESEDLEMNGVGSRRGSS